MVIFEQIQTFFDTLDNRGWLRFLGIYFATLLMLIIGIFYLYYSATSYWISSIDDLNDTRSRARIILKKAQRVYSQRAEVNKIIQDEPDFIIAAYLQEVMAKTGIASSLNTINTTQIDREEQYRENSATVSFTGTTMRQLTEFLKTVDQNKRLYTKEIEISNSKKTPHAIDVTVVISTMQPRQTSAA